MFRLLALHQDEGGGAVNANACSFDILTFLVAQTLIHPESMEIFGAKNRLVSVVFGAQCAPYRRSQLLLEKN